MSNKKHILICYPIILVVIVFDQLTKFFSTGIEKNIIPNFLSFSYRENTGGAWSILSGNVVLLAILSVVFITLMVIFSYKFKEKTPIYSVSYAFILGGALGNLIDRIFFGYVRDFIKVDFINFPIFNIADSFLVIGVILFGVFLIFFYPKKEAMAKK